MHDVPKCVQINWITMQNLYKYVLNIPQQLRTFIDMSACCHRLGDSPGFLLNLDKPLLTFLHRTARRLNKS